MALLTITGNRLTVENFQLATVGDTVEFRGATLDVTNVNWEETADGILLDLELSNAERVRGRLRKTVTLDDPDYETILDELEGS